jgi:hypothetical protein
MRLALRSILVSCALVLAAVPAHATPIDVRVLSETYIRAVPDNGDSLVCLCMGMLFALLGKRALT